MKRYILFSLFMIVFFSVNVPGFSQDEVMFNYQGKIKIQGSLFDGIGHFKFAIVNNPGNVTLWSNDMTSTAGNEPLGYISTQVDNGIFNVMIGDPLLGMTPIDSALFNYPNRIKLRIWFNDGEHGFQHLHPDRHLANVHLLGITNASRPLTIYVDPLLGDDANSGLTTSTAKRTIQSAWDSLPSMISTTATIQLADGIYFQETCLTGKSAVGNTSICIRGDADDPSNVRITGAISEMDDTPVRNYCFHILNQKNLYVEGISFESTPQDAVPPGIFFRYGAGIMLENSSIVKLKKCKFSKHFSGITVISRSSVDVEDVEIFDCIKYGSYISEGTGHFYICDFHDLNIGVFLGRNSNGHVAGCVITNTHCGFWVTFLSTTTFYPLKTTIIHSNPSDVGVTARRNSIVTYANDYVDYVGTGIDTEVASGAQYFH